jgi:hypothetical protein
MKLTFAIAFLLLIIISCGSKKAITTTAQTVLPIAGTWKLLSGTLIEKGDTTITDYTQKLSFIKIINNSHFAFLNHDMSKGKDAAAASFGAGGGSYTLKDNLYTEQLEYCNDRQWEGNKFEFIISIQNDTLVQTGIEEVEGAGVNRLNIEKYVRIKN